MDIDFDSRLIRIAAGELSQFRLGPREGGGSREGRWRMELGSFWHVRLQDEESAAAQKSGEIAPRFEVPVSGKLLRAGWTVEVSGRIDQIVTRAGAPVIREVKTVPHPLPLPEEALAARYPDYFAQAGVYLALARLGGDASLAGASAELLFVDMEGGARQVVRVEEASDLERRLADLAEFAEARRGCRARIAAAVIEPPFAELRQGQEKTAEALAGAAAKSRIVLWEAPTGFGKSAWALHHALARMKAGEFSRAIYLSGRSTGQVQVVKELEKNWPGIVRAQQMRSRSDHAIASPMHTCGEGASCREGIEEAWARAGISPARIAAEGALELEAARRLGAETGVCPYEITRAVLPFADLWIGDMNYVFSPHSSGVFLNAPGFDAAKTLLVVDEAHNLPRRAEDAWSAALDSGRLEQLRIELSFAHPSRRLSRALDSLASFVRRLNACDRCDDTVFYEVKDLLHEYTEALESERLDTESLRGGALEALWELEEAALPLENESLRLLLHSPAHGKLEITCLDASAEVAKALKSFGGALLMSATLRPLAPLLASCGLKDADAAFVRSVAPWRGMGYSVAVDERADTRLKTRARYHALAAEAIGDLAASATGPVAAFFPSYRYAADVAETLAIDHPGLRLALQPRGIDLAAQREFVATALDSADVLLLVLGSGFSEGIDELGGRVNRAIVVSPALPEADAVQVARMEEARGSSSAKAFHETYAVPGMRKVNQAIGRLVRAPGQEAKVLLFCRRFAEAQYQGLLDEDFAPQATIRSRGELLAWLEPDGPAR